MPDWLKVIAGLILFCVHSCCRWSDAQRLKSLQILGSGSGAILFAQALGSQTSSTAEAKTRFLPYTAVARGVSDVEWASEWLAARDREGINFSAGVCRVGCQADRGGAMFQCLQMRRGTSCLICWPRLMPAQHQELLWGPTAVRQRCSHGRLGPEGPGGGSMGDGEASRAATDRRLEAMEPCEDEESESAESCAEVPDCSRKPPSAAGSLLMPRMTVS